MRQLSVLTTVALTVAVVTSSAFGGALTATDPPDIRLLVGTPLNDAFDLNDYFVGGTLADGTVDIAGAAAPGVSAQTYDITVGADTVTVGNAVNVTSFLVANGPAIDGLASSSANPFVNALRPGVAVSSVSALVGGGGAAQAVTPGPVTGPAWTVTMSSVSSGYQDGLRVRSANVIAGPQNDSLSAGGLTAEIDAAGNYTLTSDAGFGGSVIVGFTSIGADGALDGALVLAAASIPAGADYTVNDTPVTADGLQILSPVSVSGEVTVSVDATAAAGVQIALAVLEAPGGAPTGALAYVNPLATGSKQTLSVTYNSASGTIIPAVQAAGGTATFENLTIIAAPAIPDLAIGANAVDLFEAAGLAAGPPLDGSFNGLTDVSAFAFSPNGAAGSPALSADNNFGAAGQSIALGGEADAATFDNISIVAGASAPGHVKATVWAKGTGHLDLVMIQIGAAGQQTAIGNQGDIDYASWTPVSAAGQLIDAGTLLVVAQGVGTGAIMVDDVTVTQVQDLPEYFDATLHGL